MIFSHAREISRAHEMPNQSYTQDSKGLHIQSFDLKNTRDLRALLLEAGFAILEDALLPSVHIHLLQCTLAKKRVQLEVEEFKRLLRTPLAKRIFLHDSRTIETGDASPLDSVAPRLPTSANQEAVVAYLLQRFLKNEPAVSVKRLSQGTQAGLGTVYKVVNRYQEYLDRDPEVVAYKLRCFPQAEWLHWMQRTNRLSSVNFVDRSGAPRSSARLAANLSRLNRSELAIGGLLGALHHLPDLDATASPQLDILVHGTRRADLSFVREIDPGLEQSNDRQDMAKVVVHFIDRPVPLFERQGDRLWGSLPDCIANMHKAGLWHQVNDALQLIQQSTSGRGPSNA